MNECLEVSKDCLLILSLTQMESDSAKLIYVKAPVSQEPCLPKEITLLPRHVGRSLALRNSGFLMQIEVSLPLSNCPCKGYMEEQYVSFSKKYIDRTINTKPLQQATNFPVGLPAPPSQEWPIGMPRLWRGF